ncbi:MAG: DUF4124 domain-containing protein [Burkholderiales bacterium]|nr:DUF4124 domain-containing protein [Burkholderiales bacterium]
MFRPVSTLLACALCFGLAAQAQVYKNVMPDGRIIYSDAPLKGAKSSPVNVPPPPTEGDKAKASERAQQETRERDALNERLDQRRKRLDDADQRVEKARKDLASAQLALEQGRTPMPGEMIANVGGGARPGENYLARIASLEKAVESAKKELDNALNERNQAR